MDEHPGLVFRDGPAGRRAALAAGADVWQIIEVTQAFAEQEPADAVQRAADWLGLSPTLVQAAVGYYAVHCDETDTLLRRNADAFSAAVGEL